MRISTSTSFLEQRKAFCDTVATQKSTIILNFSERELSKLQKTQYYQLIYWSATHLLLIMVFGRGCEKKKKTAWENRQHFAISPRNNVWGTSAEIPCWRRVTTRIWVVLLIGLSNASLLWNFCARFAGKPLVAPPNVGCFLGLKTNQIKNKQKEHLIFNR